jgi:hypothetical protein
MKSCQKLAAVPHRAVKALQTASDPAMTRLRLVRSAISASGTPRTE